jgi:hypothetical protein
MSTGDLSRKQSTNRLLSREWVEKELWKDLYAARFIHNLFLAKAKAALGDQNGLQLAMERALSLVPHIVYCHSTILLLQLILCVDFYHSEGFLGLLTMAVQHLLEFSQLHGQNLGVWMYQAFAKVLRSEEPVDATIRALAVWWAANYLNSITSVIP